jgi:hypothetical protein
MRTEVTINRPDYVVNVVDALEYALPLAKAIDTTPVLVSVQIVTKTLTEAIVPATFIFVFIDSRAKGKTCSVSVDNLQMKARIMGIGNGLKIADIVNRDPDALSLLDLSHLCLDVGDVLVLARSNIGEELLSAKSEVELVLHNKTERLIWTIIFDCAKSGVHRQISVDAQTGTLTDESCSRPN